MAERINIGYSVPQSQRLTYKVSPHEGQLMTAKSIGGQIVAIAKLLESVTNKEDPSSKWRTAIDSIETHADGSITFDLIIMPAIRRACEEAEAGSNDRHALLQAIELLDTLNEWFGQRLKGEKETNSESVLFEQTYARLNLIDQLVPNLRSPTPTGDR